MSLVHFDAHSDLSVPPISADSVFNKEELFRCVNYFHYFQCIVVTLKLPKEYLYAVACNIADLLQMKN